MFLYVEQANPSAQLASNDNRDAPQVAAYQFHKKHRPHPPRQQAELLYHQALLTIKRQQEQLAIPALREALRVYQRHQDGRRLLVALLIKQSELSEAETLLNDGLALQPESADLLRLRGHLHIQRKEYADAVSVLERMTKTNKVDSRVYAMLAVAYRGAGLHKNAADVYRHLLQQGPENALWWLGLALALDAGNANQDALQAYHYAANGDALVGRVKQFVEQRIQALAKGNETS